MELLALPWVKGVLIAIVIACAGGLAYWLVRRLTTEGIGGGGARGRQPRLGLIDQSSVDGRRRLVLIRRDNVEHLLMIGGPTDIVIEQNIVRAVPVAREMPAAAGAGLSDVLARAAEPARELPIRATLEEEMEPAVREPEFRRRPEPPRSEPPRRAAEAGAMPNRAHADELHGAEPMAARGGDLRGRVEPSWPELNTRPSRAPEPAATRPATEVSARGSQAEMPVRSAPPITPPGPKPAAQSPPPRDSAPAPAMASDTEITDMAQRLEAALRRPFVAKESRSQPGTPRPGHTSGGPQAPRQAGPSRQPAKAEAEATAEPASAIELKATGQSVLDSLEQEMASLLGRPAGKD